MKRDLLLMVLIALVLGGCSSPAPIDISMNAVVVETINDDLSEIGGTAVLRLSSRGITSDDPTDIYLMDLFTAESQSSFGLVSANVEDGLQQFPLTLFPTETVSISLKFSVKRFDQSWCNQQSIFLNALVYHELADAWLETQQLAPATFTPGLCP